MIQKNVNNHFKKTTGTKTYETKAWFRCQQETEWVCSTAADVSLPTKQNSSL